MSIFKRGRTYWFHFWWNGEHVQRSTKQGNPRVARQIEAAHRTRLAKGEVGIVEKKPAPRLSDFAEKFRDAIQVRCAEKALTVKFYNSKLDRLLEFDALASAKLDAIDEGLVEAYVQYRRTPSPPAKKGDPSKVISPASVNRELATLRRMLGLAYEWHVIDRIPVIKKLAGERSREFVLGFALESEYLRIAPQPLNDAALLMLDTGLRVGEVVALEKADVNLDPANGARFGYVRIRDGKSRNARRVVSLTARVRYMLEIRVAGNESRWVFPGDNGNAFLATSLDHQHSKVRAKLGLSKDFVIHSFRHSMLSRLGEAGVDAFTIMRIAGHSSVKVSERYVHPSPEAMERAFERLEAFNTLAGERAAGTECSIPATVSATLEDSMPANTQQIVLIQ
jgi:integrase